jgi:hypothetical protein
MVCPIDTFFFDVFYKQFLEVRNMDNGELVELLKLMSQFKNAKKLRLFFLIAEKPNLGFSQLRKEMQWDTNDLNHRLADLKLFYLIASDDGHYSLTKIGHNLHSLFKNIGNDPSAIKLSATIQAMNEILQCPRRER